MYIAKKYIPFKMDCNFEEIVQKKKNKINVDVTHRFEVSHFSCVVDKKFLDVTKSVVRETVKRLLFAIWSETLYIANVFQ